ncbi:MAG TPA: HAMP domain-containing sensor histidine kinase [Bryobacteraceae bacterium]|nr:HAMP domain-containing sensor histidine kinase [Bryobacteraceae bacterium]
MDLPKENPAIFQDLAMIVHGLRNPASSILSVVEYLMEDASNVLSHQQMGLLQGAAQSSLFILRMIENILSFSKIESDKLMLNFDSADLMSLVKDVVNINQPLAQRKGLHIRISVDIRELIINIDPTKITQVIDNLLANGIKFSRSGGEIEIEIRSSRNSVLISIRDEGIGISPERIEAIFEPFQISRTTAGSYRTGTGLGLAISKRIVELHAGTITVQSEVGKGSIFTISLPKRIDAKAILADPRRTSLSKSLSIQ